MNDMKLIMEGWRQYRVRETQFVFLLEGDRLVAYDLANESRLMKESNDPRRMERLFEAWLVQADAMLNEGVADFISDLKDKAVELTGRAKEAFKRFIDNPYLELSLQLYSMMTRVKQVSSRVLKKIISVLKKLDDARLKFKKDNPMLYGVLSMVTKVAIAFVVYYAISSLLGAGGAEAAVQMGTTKSSVVTTDSESVQAVIGILKSHGHQDVAQELAKAVSSPETFNIADFKPEYQKMIEDSVQELSRTLDQVNRFSTPGAESIQAPYLEKMSSMIDSGQQILQDLANKAADLDPGGTATQSAQTIGNAQLYAQNQIMGIVNSLNNGDVKAAIEIVKQMRGSGLLPDETISQVIELTKQADISGLTDAAKQVTKAGTIGG